MGRDKKDKKDKKSHKKSHKKKSKSHKRRSRSYDSDSGNSEDDKPEFARDAESAHIAAEYVRCILKKFPAMKAELRDLLWRIDSGEGIQIDGLAGDTLRGIRGLLGALNLHRSKTGTYSLKAGQDKILRRIGVVFSEQFPDHSNKPMKLPGDPDTPPPSPPVQDTLRNTDTGHDRRDSPANGPRGDAVGNHRSVSRSASPAEPAGRRTLGPAAAPERLLQAAAEAAAAMKEEGLLDDVVSGLPAAFVGPAPPAELLEELTGVSMNAREREVRRILELEARDNDVDPYELLAVAPDAASGIIRKAFWRLSLLVHPDKCKHERAADAFNALKKAAEALGTAETRQDVDAKRQRKEDDALNKQVMEELEKERLWRLAQGTATVDDARGEVGAPEVRDEWMTALPEKRTMNPAYMDQKGVSAFASQSSQAAAQDASWTALPGQTTRQQLHLTFGAPGGGHGRTKRPDTAEDVIAQKNAELMRLARREEERPEDQVPQKTLLEKHQASQAEAKAQRKEAKRKREETTDRAAEKDSKPEWASRSAWRPFDREKDLQIQKPGGMGPSAGASLASRFKPASS